MQVKAKAFAAAVSRFMGGTAGIALIGATFGMVEIPQAQAQPQSQATGVSPALCGAGDVREPGIQGEVPTGQTASYNCGVKVLGSLPVVGNVAGVGQCAYVRTGGQGGAPGPIEITVIDVRDPKKPVVVGQPLPLELRSETLRVVATKDRAIMVSGSSVYDVSDCLHPKLAGQIKWPDTTVPGVRARNLPHDIRINRTATKVFASFGVWEADISDLKAPDTWKVIDHRCEVAAQLPGPWQEVHRASIKAGRSLCDDAAKAAPAGANYSMGGSPLQVSMLWPQVSHSPDFNADDTRLYVGDQAGGNGALWAPVPKVRIVDITKRPFEVIGELDGAGHGLDWFRAGGREYVIHSNEGTSAIPGKPHDGDSCAPYPRPYALGWAFEAYISDVSDPARAHDISMVQLAINKPEFCNVRKASGQDPWIAYHLIDNPMDAKFTAVNFGDAGLRIFDIRNPDKPTEVAYFNHGRPVHAQVGYYDAARKLIYFSDGTGFKVLQIEPQVRSRLGI
ncbi:hypothetical protein EDF56_107180 [Novosphingobium sp. PhB165]|uniref:hypothetical protein n=1 Tax=Novosphingobium sp. PhB165 TaxID=2485105 RepID=UPI001051D860|nr:hypothetical protein [Novosphingobium sp. PhB165]TCM16601.1 hypothetical protein EDF56_107180 [Novosphingobium sp. PhB165]